MPLFVLLAVLLLPQYAYAADWQVVDFDDEYETYYIDKESIQKLSDGHYRFGRKKYPMAL